MHQRSQSIPFGDVAAARKAELRVEAIGPAPDLAHLAERAGLDVFRDERLERARMSVVPDLRHDSVLARRLKQQIRLLLAIADGLFDVHVYAAPHCREREWRVRLLVGRDYYRVHLVGHLVEELAEVGEEPYLGLVVLRRLPLDLLPHFVEARRVWIDHCHDFLVVAFAHQHRHTTAASYERDADFRALGDLARPAQAEVRASYVEQGQRGHSGGHLDEFSSFHGG